MIEFEIATLTLARPTPWVAVARIAAILVIGLGRIDVVRYGTRAMQRAGP